MSTEDIRGSIASLLREINYSNTQVDSQRLKTISCATLKLLENKREEFIGIKDDASNPVQIEDSNIKLVLTP